MTVGEILASPYTWVAFGTCFIAGWYVKGDVFGALTYATIAPPVLFLLVLIVSFALMIPAFVISKLAPQVWSESTRAFLSLPEPLQFLLSPPFLVTVWAFTIHCRSAREVPERPYGKSKALH
jgi:hypothetical protein